MTDEISLDFPDGDEQPTNTELDELADTQLRLGETSDPDVAAEEGMPWVPPVDPPVVPSAEGDPQDLEIAAGFGVTGSDEPIDDDHRSEELSDEEDMTAKVRDALRADAATSRYADELVIGTLGGVVVLRGEVDDLEDSDNAVDVAGRVSGVTDVIDELDVRALE